MLTALYEAVSTQGRRFRVEELEAGRTHLWLKDIKKEDHVRGLYLAKVKRTGSTKRGDPFLSITLGDRTGEMEARVWEKVEEFSPLFSEGDILYVEGYAGSYQNQIQLTLSHLRVSGDASDPSLFVEATARDIAEMMGSLKASMKVIENPHLSSLVERFLSDRTFISLFKKAPAAKGFHHSYLGGLLEHTLSVCQMVRSVTEHYPELDRDLLMTGAFLHDIGKVRELSFERKIDYTDEGRLIGHIILGVGLVDEKLGSMKNFPQELGVKLKHLILSHHGEYEFGSPKRPKFIEAFALHLIDDLDAKLNGVSRFMERDQQEGSWTDFNRLLERYFFKARAPSTVEQEDNARPEEGRQKGLFEK